MNTIKCITATALLTLTSTSATFMRSEAHECAVANLLNYKDQVQDIQAFIEQKVPINAMITGALAKLDTNTGAAKAFPPTRKHALGYDFDFTFTLNNLKVTGMDSLKINPLEITGESTIKSSVGFNSPLTVAASMNLEIDQVPTLGCKEDEENYLGLCYKKCAILTGGSHPRRSATNTCTKAEAGFLGIHAPWTKGLGCNGFGVSSSGGCATPAANYCFTEGIAGFFRVKDTPCDKKNIKIDVSLALNQPQFQIASTLEVMTCKNANECPSLLEYFKNLVLGKESLKRVKTFVVQKAGLTLGANPDVDVKLDTGSIVGTVLTIAFGQGVNYVKSQNLIPKVEEQISTYLTPIINTAIQTKLQVFFGTNC